MCRLSSVEKSRSEGLKSWLNDIDHSALMSSEDDKRLAIAACIVEEMRAAVYSDTGFRCSAGIAHNKVKTLTVLPHPAVKKVILLFSAFARNLLFSSFSVKFP